MEKIPQKSWKDRMPPDGHLPASYEVQVCDEGNKVIAVQMLDKAGIDYKISARKGQFFIQACDMETFTKVRHILNQTIDMNKEADKLGFKPELPSEVTPVATNTPQADITAANVAVTAPVKEEMISEGNNNFYSYISGITENKLIKSIIPAMKSANFSTNQRDTVQMINSGKKLSPGEFLWCLDSLILFVNDFKDMLKELKKQTKEEYSKKELSE